MKFLATLVAVITMTLFSGVASAMATTQTFPSDAEYPKFPLGGGISYIATRINAHDRSSGDYNTGSQTHNHLQGWNGVGMNSFDIYVSILIDPRNDDNWSSEVALPGVNGVMHVAPHGNLDVTVSNPKINKAGDGYIYTWDVQADNDGASQSWKCVLTWDGGEWWTTPTPACYPA